jgi:hypothetical protein
MKADISDAPERVIRRRCKHSVLYKVACLAIGGIATISAFLLISRPLSLDTTHKQSIGPVVRVEETGRANEMPSRQVLESSLPRASSEIPLPATTYRQTVFNDQNFVPRGADNVVAFRTGPDPYPAKAAPKGVDLTIIRQSRSMKERACWPYRQGSVESRNCRASIGLRHRD